MPEVTPAVSDAAIAAFIARWSAAHSAQRANYALFLSELSDLLDAPPRPDPARPDTAQNAYVFERAVTFHHRTGQTSTGRIDLYKRGAYVCECKQYAQVAESEISNLRARSGKRAPSCTGSVPCACSTLPAEPHAITEQTR